MCSIITWDEAQQHEWEVKEEGGAWGGAPRAREGGPGWHKD